MVITLHITIPKDQHTVVLDETGLSSPSDAVSLVAWSKIKESGCLSRGAVTAQLKEYGDQEELWRERFRTIDKIGKYAFIAACATVIILGGTTFGLTVANLLSEEISGIIMLSCCPIAVIPLVAILIRGRVWDKTTYWYAQAQRDLRELERNYFSEHIVKTQVDSLIAVSNSWEEFCDHLHKLREKA